MTPGRHTAQLMPNPDDNTSLCRNAAPYPMTAPTLRHKKLHFQCSCYIYLFMLVLRLRAPLRAADAEKACRESKALL